jgi:hypothetical protein
MAVSLAGALLSVGAGRGELGQVGQGEFLQSPFSLDEEPVANRSRSVKPRSAAAVMNRSRSSAMGESVISRQILDSLRSSR